MTTFHSNFIAFFALLGVLIFQSAFAPTAMADDSKYTAERIALAKAYVATLPLEQDIKKAIDALSNRVAPEDRVLFRRLGESAFDYGRLRAAAELSALDVFTDKEIKALTDFYSSPEGQSIRTKNRDYDSRMQPIINELMADFVKKLQENNIVPKNP